MPSIDDNLRSWDQDWGHDGDAWSSAWGSSEMLWRGTLATRVGRFLPAEQVLEIAPGRGRVTAFLLPLCEQYIGVDLAATCIEACRTRFASAPHARFEVTDGKSLAIVDDASVDFAMSWDSLVHADLEVLASYLAELGRVLRPGAHAFLHHSNVAALKDAAGDVPFENVHWRDTTSSAEAVRATCDGLDLHCISQEILQWGCDHHTDCFSLFRRPESAAARPETRVLVQNDMAAEMEHFARLERLYAPGPR